LKDGCLNACIELCSLKLRATLSDEETVVVLDEDEIPHAKEAVRTNIKKEYIHYLSKLVTHIQVYSSKSIVYLTGAEGLFTYTLVEQRLNKKLIGLLCSENLDVRRYAAKSFAFLSMSNDIDCKVMLLKEGGVDVITRVLDEIKVAELSIALPSNVLSTPPSPNCKDSASMPLSSSVYRSSVASQETAKYLSIVSHLSCSIANFATHGEKIQKSLFRRNTSRSFHKTKS
jgi:hypothetical protein